MNGKKTSKIFALFACIFALSFTSCKDLDGTIETIETIPSPFFIKLNQEGNFLDINHSISNIASDDIRIPNVCDWLLQNNCSQGDLNTVYFGSSFGNNQLGFYSFIITGFPYDGSENIEDLDMVDLINSLPRNNQGYADLIEGTISQGRTSGNVFIGKAGYRHGYAFNQPNYSHFRILNVAVEDFLGKKVIGIEFSFEYLLFDEDGNSAVISNGGAYLPFGLHNEAYQ